MYQPVTIVNEAFVISKIGDHYKTLGGFSKSISCYSRSILKYDDHLRCNTTLTEQIQESFQRQRRKTIESRMNAYIKLEKYDKALRDLDLLMSSICICCFPITCEWLLQRADIFFVLGNTTTALNDYESIKQTKYKTTDTCTSCGNYMKIKEDIDEKIQKATARISLDSIKFDTKDFKMSKFNEYGWERLKLMEHKHEQLPFKWSHSMIEHNGKLYCFGGTVDNNLFIQITIYKYSFKWKKLSFPASFTPKLNVTFDRMHKWNDKLVLIGNSLNDMFIYHIGNSFWDRFKVQSMRFMSPDITKSYLSVIFRNKLYIAMHSFDEKKKIRIYSLDLLTAEWILLAESEKTDIVSGDVMWIDANKGKLGSIYIAFDFDGTYWSCSMVRFDIYEKKIYNAKMYGNYPWCRSGVASTSTMDHSGVILFGGSYGDHKFADCFEYENASQRWKMVHSKVSPPNRFDASICRVGENRIVLYGGKSVESGVYLNDLWVLDMNKCETKKVKLRKCNNRKCRKTWNDCVLYKCKRCQKRRYCSIYCQKRHWKRHKKQCNLFI